MERGVWLHSTGRIEGLGISPILSRQKWRDYKRMNEVGKGKSCRGEGGSIFCCWRSRQWFIPMFCWSEGNDLFEPRNALTF